MNGQIVIREAGPPGVAAPGMASCDPVDERVAGDGTCTICQRAPASRIDTCRSCEATPGYCGACRAAVTGPILTPEERRRVRPSASINAIEAAHEAELRHRGLVPIVTVRSDLPSLCSCGDPVRYAAILICACGGCGRGGPGIEVRGCCRLCAGRLPRAPEGSQAVRVDLQGRCASTHSTSAAASALIVSLGGGGGRLSIRASEVCARHGVGVVQTLSTHWPE